MPCFSSICVQLYLLPGEWLPGGCIQACSHFQRGFPWFCNSSPCVRVTHLPGTSHKSIGRSFASWAFPDLMVYRRSVPAIRSLSSVHLCSRPLSVNGTSLDDSGSAADTSSASYEGNRSNCSVGRTDPRIKSYYYKGECGNKPYDLEQMLGIYLLQNLYSLSDPAGTRIIPN